jgi:hypothetical protein
MFGLFRKYSVSILDRKWKTIKDIVKVKHIPRASEVLFFDGEYYRVVNIVHSINNKQGIFVIVEKLETQPEE